MSWAILGMFSRRAVGAPAHWRRATPYESALTAGERPADAEGFDVFSYRVAARFAGKARIVTHPDRVVVTGPRIPVRLYQVWIWTQGLLMAAAGPLAAWGVVTLSWTPLGFAAAALFASWTISCLGAGIWPGLGEMEFVGKGAYRGLEFPLAQVREVSIGSGWARGGMATVLLPYKKAIDKMAEGQAVSFYAPDERGREVCFALHCMTAEDAARLAERLRAKAETAVA